MSQAPETWFGSRVSLGTYLADAMPPNEFTEMGTTF
jgi:hypothetical protein